MGGHLGMKPLLTGSPLIRARLQLEENTLGSKKKSEHEGESEPG